ncbi:MAG TPA: alpha-2-macroglobulin family protein [Anaerolineae bacterium]|nr:alpha-2-macroglobulin family protein [Anaerolineae bacterium]
MSHIELDLLAYLNGELSPAEMQAAEAHIAGCPACAAELVELQRLRVGLSTVVPVVYNSVHLSAAAEARIRSALAAQRGRESRAGLAGLWAALLSGLRPLSKATIPLVAVFFFGMMLSATQLPMQNGAQQTLVLGQDTLAPGSQAALRVVVNNAQDNQPLADASVNVQMRQAGLARTVFNGVTDATGSAPVQFAVPSDWEGNAELIVSTTSDLGQDEVVAPVLLQRSYRLLLSSDKPVYQPGETIHLRTLALGTVDETPASGAVTRFEVFDAAGQQLLSQQQMSSEFGIAATDLPLAVDTPLGQYQLRATLGDTVSELSVTLGQAPLPTFLVDVRADAPYYLPGELLTGQVNASYFFGKPVAGGQVALRLVGMQLGQDPAAAETLLFSEELLGESDADGLFSFQFQLPELPDDAFGSSGAIDLALEATVVDAIGDAQFGWQSLTLAREPILIDVAPEDGTLHAGVENVIYVLTSYPDGRPAPTALQVQIGSGALIEEDTNDFGVAQVRYTPRAGAEGDRAITVTATDAADQSGSTSLVLPLDEAQETLLLRTDRALYQVGDTLAVEAIATGSGPAVYLDVIKGGQTLLTQSALVEDGKATLAIDLTPALAGALELNAYQITGDNNILRDTRVALVDAAQAIQVELATDQAEYRPGQQAELSVRTTADGEGVQTAVGLAVVNEAVYGQRAYQPGFSRAFFLLDQALQASGVALPDAGEAVDEELRQLRAAQQLTAKASWVNYAGRQYSLSAQSIDQASHSAANPARQQAFSQISRGISLALVLASLLAAAIVLLGLRRSGVLGQALGRLLLTLLVLAVLGAGLIFLTQMLVDNLSDQGIWLLLAVAGGLWLALWLALLVDGWQRKDQRLQYVALLLLAYIALLALLAFAAGQGATLAPAWLVALALSFGVLLAALLLFGWGLRMEGQKRTGLGLLLLALLVMPLVVALNAVEFRGADLIQRVAGPSVYGLGNGLFTGCAAPPVAPFSEQAASELAAGDVAPPAAAPLPVPAAELAAPAESAVPVELSAETSALVEESVAAENEPDQTEAAGEEEAASFMVQPAEPKATATPEIVLDATVTPESDLATPDLDALRAMTGTVEVEAPLLTARAQVTTTIVPTETATITPTQVVTATPAMTATLTIREAEAFAQAQGVNPDDAPTSTAAPNPTPSPTLTWTPEPTPSPEPTATPPLEPTATPRSEPTDTPLPEPTATPRPEPTDTPLSQPTETPLPQPTPTAEPSVVDALAAPAAAKAAAPVEIPLESLPIIRERFPQTLYWNPEVVTDDAGRLAVSIPTGDAITTWRVTALAVDRSGRLGSAVAPLVVFQPVFVTTNLPAQMALGEQFDARVQVFNYSRQAQTVRLAVQTSAGLRVELSDASLVVPANEVVAVTARVQAVGSGVQTITATVMGDGVLDMRQTTILVQ